MTSTPQRERHVWRAGDARARFSELIERALADGPQTITRNGRKTVVIVAAAEWERRTRVGNLAEFLGAWPLRGSRLTIERC
jgi:prevent-host-death family protein